MSMYHLNIGLGAEPAKAMINMGKAMEWLGYRGDPRQFRVTMHPPVAGRIEYTLAVRVAFLHQGITSFMALADLLHQDCIAVLNVGTSQGILVGRRALEWGVFDSDLFINP